MILSAIKHYLQDSKQATLDDLAVHFDTDREAMRGMLEQWVQKGRVTRSRPQAGCSGGCTGCCCDSGLEIYTWQA